MNLVAPGAANITAARDLLNAAQRDAAQLLDESKKTHEKARIHGYREGFQQGIADALQQVLAHPVIAEKDLVEAALGIAEEVIGGQIRHYPENLKLRVQRALDLLEEQKDITLRVHPDELRFLAQQSKGLHIVGDDKMKPGTAELLIQSTSIIIDPWTHFERIRDTLLERVQNEVA